MKTLTFKYTKKDGSISERTLLAMVTPTDKYAGIDVSELSEVDAANFIEKANKLHADYLMSMLELQRTFDINHNYRQFLASGISDLDEI